MFIIDDRFDQVRYHMHVYESCIGFLIIREYKVQPHHHMSYEKACYICFG